MAESGIIDQVRIVLVGPQFHRRRLRAQLPEDLVVVAEAGTISEARQVRDVDAYVVAPVSPGDNHAVEDRVLVDPLTPRELEVLDALVDGLPNKAIAARLGISDETVKFHLNGIFGKLGASNRTDAVRQALRRGLVEL